MIANLSICTMIAMGSSCVGSVKSSSVKVIEDILDWFRVDVE